MNLLINFFSNIIIQFRDRIIRSNYDNNNYYLNKYNRYYYYAHFICTLFYITLGSYIKNRYFHLIGFLFSGILSVIPISKLSNQSIFIGKIPYTLSILFLLNCIYNNQVLINNLYYLSMFGSITFNTKRLIKYYIDNQYVETIYLILSNVYLFLIANNIKYNFIIDYIFTILSILNIIYFICTSHFMEKIYYKNKYIAYIYEYIRVGVLNTLNLNTVPINTSYITNNNGDNFNYNLYRTYDGTYNNLNKPFNGSINQYFSRNILNKSSELSEFKPNPILVANKLLLRTNESYKHTNILNLFTTAWIQFMIHDWFEHKKSNNKTIIEYNNQNFIFNELEINNDYSINVQSAYWDASQIYGSNINDANKLRETINDELSYKMKIINDYIPLENNREITGNNNNFWFGIGLLNLIFLKEHNYIGGILKELYPTMTNEDIYQKCRLIIAASIAKIHTTEWTCAIIDNDFGKYLQNVFIWDGHTQNKDYTEKINFNHSEEFAAVYKMHSLLPDDFTIFDYQNQNKIITLEIKDFIFNKSANINNKYDKNNLIYSMGTSNIGLLLPQNNPNIFSNLSLHHGNQINLTALDIYRDRKLKIPRYNDFRRGLHLKPLDKFSDLTKDKNLLKNLMEVYNSVEEIDLQVGLIYEEKLPGFVFGDTTYSIFTFNTIRRITNDRFLNKCFTKEYYTEFGINHVKNITFSKILLRHFNLKNYLTKDQNAFFNFHSNRKIDKYNLFGKIN